MSFLCEVFPPAEIGLTPTPPRAAISDDQNVLLEALRPSVPLALWLREVPRGWARSFAPLLAHAPFCHVSEALPDAAVEAIAAALPEPAPVELFADMFRLGQVFTAMTGHNRVRLRLEAITGDACRKFHVDAVGYRMLCTDAGAGTEWCMGDPQQGCRIARVPMCSVALFRGRRLAGHHCLHRSPPLSRGQGGPRLLACFDEPGVLPHE